MLISSQGVVDIYNQNFVLPVTTDEKNNKPRKTIYKEIDEKYFKESE